MRNVTVAAIQMACTDSENDCLAIAEKLVRDAVGQGANIILLQELFSGPYFCQDVLAENLARARPTENHPVIEFFQVLAAELSVVLPISIYELAGQSRFNSIAILDADGKNVGANRKSHIPQDTGYQEKFYFSPGDSGFNIWGTKFGRIGVGICWDQWFPECACSMVLMGGKSVLLDRNRIGSRQR